MQVRRKSASFGSIVLWLSWVLLAAPGATAHSVRGATGVPDGSTVDEPQPQSAEAPEAEADGAEGDAPEADEPAQADEDENATDPAPVTDESTTSDSTPAESTRAVPAENDAASEPAQPGLTRPAPALPARPATNPSPPPAANEQEDATIYKVVLNHEEQYSIWPAARENALGWNDAGFSGSKADCLEYIKRVWTDMRPLSLRKKMEEAAKPPGR